MSSGSLVLVTGVSGFLGSHVVTELLKDGYRVRGYAYRQSAFCLMKLTEFGRTVRSKKVAFVQAWYAKYEGKVEIVAFDDLIAGDITDALKGLWVSVLREKTAN
ncbi:hypothetical protein PHLCEN_2v7289 [Hermanssonia centrifuga]|uniref:NAD-dependent epimerase/dehydratase domain-containing protein n=1 Tax=Hermanssonia centrifuga TaxID=98765 RepID=A0A2R6NWW8_9APHY|nr:hypothetical protein PHLCEN_2v7289 [Hermanssonia centrifuga]